MTAKLVEGEKQYSAAVQDLRNLEARLSEEKHRGQLKEKEHAEQILQKGAELESMVATLEKQTELERNRLLQEIDKARQERVNERAHLESQAEKLRAESAENDRVVQGQAEALRGQESRILQLQDAEDALIKTAENLQQVLDRERVLHEELKETLTKRKAEIGFLELRVSELNEQLESSVKLDQGSITELKTAIEKMVGKGGQ